MQPAENVYSKKYTERQLLGRGNFGSAFLVTSNIDGEYFVAKKMMLGGMSEQEVKAAWEEIEILKKVNEVKNPFIVMYHESFCLDNTLIIVMEYCECKYFLNPVGDLAGFLKARKKTGEPLPEIVVVNWLIQLLFGIQALHSRNVLHRDLKSANVFLTASKTVKIGDFGISKVLDTTSAKTFVGTPYYLSPEVCSNRPYKLEADLWSLGCIIYELCAFNYPFQASNLLGLAMKIMTEEVPRIPSCYSDELNGIIQGLFMKDEKKRITIKAILSTSYIQKYGAILSTDQSAMEKLVFTSTKKVPVKEEEEQPQEEASKTKNSQADTMKTIQSNFEASQRGADTLEYSSSLTPKQKLALKKLQQADERASQLKQEHLQNASLRDFAKKRKQQTLNSSNGMSQDNRARDLQKQFLNDNKKRAECEKTLKTFQGFQKKQDINLSQLHDTINKLTKGGKISVESVNFEEVPLPSESQFVKFNPVYDKLAGTEIAEEIDEELQEYYDEPFEQYVEQEPVGAEKVIQIKKEFENVMAFYSNQLGSDSDQSEKGTPGSRTRPTNDNLIGPTTPERKLKECINKCVSLIGEQRYQQLYLAVKKGQINYATIKKTYKDEEQRAIKMIDEIVFLETSQR